VNNMGFQPQAIIMPGAGVCLVYPTEFNMRISGGCQWNEITMEGVVIQQSDTQTIKAATLSCFSVVDLMGEVRRRIKAGVNIEEKRG